MNTLNEAVAHAVAIERRRKELYARWTKLNDDANVILRDGSSLTEYRAALDVAEDTQHQMWDLSTDFRNAMDSVHQLILEEAKAP